MAARTSGERFSRIRSAAPAASCKPMDDDAAAPKSRYPVVMGFGRVSSVFLSRSRSRSFSLFLFLSLSLALFLSLFLALFRFGSVFVPLRFFVLSLSLMSSVHLLIDPTKCARPQDQRHSSKRPEWKPKQPISLNKWSKYAPFLDMAT